MNRHVQRIKNEVRAELQRLSVANDGLRASQVVKAARDKDSPLHDSFEWDNHKAGHAYRLMQARVLIRVKLQPVEREPGAQDDDMVLGPWVHVPPTQEEVVKNGSAEGVYRPLQAVVVNEDWFCRALEEARAAFVKAIQRMNELRDAANAQGDDDKRTKVNLAFVALENARAAIDLLH